MEENSTYLLPIIGEIGVQFRYTDLLMHLNAAKDSSTIHIVVGSPGGYIDEGLKIRDALLKCGKILKASNSGDVASIAVSIFLAAPKGLRTFDPSKGVFLIHNPLIQPSDLIDAAYTSEDFALMSKELKGFENDLAKQYVGATGSDIEVLKAFMAENKPLTPEQITALGFATIEQPQFKAVALIHNKKQEMENKEVIESLKKHETLLDKIHKKLFAKNIMLQDVNGVEIDFGDAVETPEQIVVGVEAKVDGKPAEGKYVLPDGKTIVCAAGKVTEVIETPSDDMEALRTENETLKAENATMLAAQNQLQKELTDFKASAETQLTEAQKEFKAFKAQYSKVTPPANAPAGDGEKTNRVAQFLHKKE